MKSLSSMTILAMLISLSPYAQPLEITIKTQSGDKKEEKEEKKEEKPEEKVEEKQEEKKDESEEEKKEPEKPKNTVLEINAINESTYHVSARARIGVVGKPDQGEIVHFEAKPETLEGKSTYIASDPDEQFEFFADDAKVIIKTKDGLKFSLTCDVVRPEEKSEEEDKEKASEPADDEDKSKDGKNMEEGAGEVNPDENKEKEPEKFIAKENITLGIFPAQPFPKCRWYLDLKLDA